MMHTQCIFVLIPTILPAILSSRTISPVAIETSGISLFDFQGHDLKVIVKM